MGKERGKSVVKSTDKSDEKPVKKKRNKPNKPVGRKPYAWMPKDPVVRKKIKALLNKSPGKLPTEAAAIKLSKASTVEPKRDPIYVPNPKYNLTDWLPKPTDVKTKIETNSWFDIDNIENPNPSSVDMYHSTYPVIPPESYKQQMDSIKQKNLNKVPVFIKTDKIRLYPTEDQKKILNQWFCAFAKMFNVTVNHIRRKIFIDGKLDLANATKAVGFKKLRGELLVEKQAIQKLSNCNRIPIHILDEAIHQASSNYKTCLTNLKKKRIKKFRVRTWSMTKRRKILKIESLSFRDGTFCSSVFPQMESSKPLVGIKMTTTLLYDGQTKKYLLLVPVDEPEKTRMRSHLDCGIDPGVRTFATVYSESDTYGICNSGFHQPKVKSCQRKIDKINSLFRKDVKDSNWSDNYCFFDRVIDGETVIDVKIKDNRNLALNRALRKCHRKITNKMRDMHFKAAHFLVNTYDNIYIGKFNTRSILSNKNTTITSQTKREIGMLAPYMFTQRLIHMGYKYGTRVIAVDEYLTTKTCSNCGQLNELGDAKVHACKCGMVADRDENAAKNILKVGYAADV